MPYADPVKRDECKRRWAQAHRGRCSDCGVATSKEGRRCGSCAAKHWQPAQVCSLEGCGERATGLGWCRSHYNRWYRTGSPEFVVRVTNAERVCAVEGCTAPVQAHSWCERHYKRWAKHGDPLMRGTSAGETFRSAEERLWSKVDKDGPTPIGCPELGRCWLWTAALNKGYGQVHWQGTMRQAYKVAYELLVGPVPSGLDLDHLCETTRCVNPAHLEPVTHTENVRRAAQSRREREAA